MPIERNTLPSYQGYIFDLDGTVYRGGEAIPGAAEAIARLRNRGARVVFLSNKPLETREAYAKKLSRLGIPTRPEEVITSAYVLGERLAKAMPGARLYVIGEPPLLEILRGYGLVITDGLGEVDVVVASFDRTFDYKKLTRGFWALRRGARFVATNPDRSCPVDPAEGGEIPDAAAVIGALEGCTGRQVEWIAGKPSPLMLEAALAALGVPRDQCLMVGDRLETDIRMGKEGRVPTALVLTGVTRREDVAASPWQPDYVLPSVAVLA